MPEVLLSVVETGQSVVVSVDAYPGETFGGVVYAINPRAIAAYERVGFVREGVLRDALRWDGEYHDAIVMSLLDRDRAVA